jgi:hypothetical protein
VPYPNDRRKHSADTEESLSPEFLAMLVACGGEVRAEDRPAVSEAGVERRRRRRANDGDGAPDQPLTGNR